MTLYSVILSIGAANGAVLAALILRSRHNRFANAALSMLLGAVLLSVVVYIIGYAGAYDRWPWLTFCPLDWSLSFGPLLWIYVVCLTTGVRPNGLGFHFAPLGMHLAYQVVCFALPMPEKWAWFTGTDRHLVAPFVQGFYFIQLGVYLALSGRAYLAYTAWLVQRFGDARPRTAWLGAILGTIGVYWLMAIGFSAWHWWVHPLDYFQRFPVMIAFCLLVYILGLMGWRYSGLNWPHAYTTPEPAQRTDYSALVREWRLRIEAEGWWRDEALSLPSLAKRLAVSERTLSRGLREGSGESFSSFINAYRVRAITNWLDAGATSDFLTLAAEAGFASKANFNRAFKAVTGMTPSAYRQVKAAQIPPIAHLGGQ
ncbi:helix-turn-helix domain-containing protein [Asticcacaulis sp. 201]|uniref:AraC family transcriptional regulator n=1 Tax=Asticcacaulis sp. 201 TaxID=3028787 RepID=UPI0029171290|nr:helix-turn-helix domain-containing protein [Asticcacaulis sp. 201]MDV6330968.1 helix-turn-helix domain-containing protein [Asticcacaulis sp. 201]